MRDPGPQDPHHKETRERANLCQATPREGERSDMCCFLCQPFCAPMKRKTLADTTWSVRGSVRPPADSCMANVIDGGFPRAIGETSTSSHSLGNEAEWRTRGSSARSEVHRPLLWHSFPSSFYFSSFSSTSLDFVHVTFPQNTRKPKHPSAIPISEKKHPPLRFVVMAQL